MCCFPSHASLLISTSTSFGSRTGAVRIACEGRSHWAGSGVLGTVPDLVGQVAVVAARRGRAVAAEVGARLVRPAGRLPLLAPRAAARTAGHAVAVVHQLLARRPGVRVALAPQALVGRGRDAHDVGVGVDREVEADAV